MTEMLHASWTTIDLKQRWNMSTTVNWQLKCCALDRKWVDECSVRSIEKELARPDASCRVLVCPVICEIPSVMLFPFEEIEASVHVTFLFLYYPLRTLPRRNENGTTWIKLTEMRPGRVEGKGNEDLCWDGANES